MLGEPVKTIKANWNDDLSYGKRAEAIVGNFIQNHIGASGLYFTKGYDTTHDLGMYRNDSLFTFEVKAQRAAETTRNWFGEFQSCRPGKPDTGLTATKAKYIVDAFIYGESPFFTVAKVSDVLHLANVSGQCFTNRENCGDGWKTNGKTMPLNQWTGLAFVKVFYLP